MIERDFVSRKKKEFQIQEFIKNSLRGVGLSHTKIQRTPLGEKIIISASRPGLIIGSGGSNIKKLTAQLKKEFGLENPQIEINEIQNTSLVAAVVAEKIAITLEKYGTMRFKGTGHKAMAEVLSSGGRGVEILISGKIPSSRARVWRFYQGYLKKCGHAAQTLVDKAYAVANLKSGIVGIQVSIMPPDVRLPDDVRYIEAVEPVVEELTKKESEKIVEELKKESVTKETSKENVDKKTKPIEVAVKDEK
jgi:small subunit ribosomal protein S3